mmetsp:Transcript_13559/g.28038  ORF Transcript_13559/g.28038 Transcript_13559/m.28038 type:complete len:311 (-) Transcript_13559:2090-3022(-)
MAVRPFLWRLPSCAAPRTTLLYASRHHVPALSSVLPSKRWKGTRSSNERKNFVGLNKLMAQNGLCSRKEADLYLANGWIRMNGEILTKEKHIKVDASKIVTLELTDEGKRDQSQRATILIHKPSSIVSCQPESEEQIPAVQLLTADRQYMGGSRNPNYQKEPKVNPNNYHPRFQKNWRVAGRLDQDSTGLLVLTQSGQIARQIIEEGSTMEKEYLVRIPGNTPNLAGKIEQLRKGVVHDGERLEAASVDQVFTNQLRIVLTAGKKHHIRRMFRALNCQVQALKRVRIGKVVLGDLPVGQWRYLGRQESFK